MNDIVREVYVKRKTLDSPISYIRATNAVGLKFRFCDFDIPEDTQARVYVQKPSGKAAYNDALIEGNEVKVEVTTQMFAEAGECQLQLNLVKDEKTLVTFIQTVNVCANYTEGDALKSQNESGFFTEYEEKLDTAVANANKAAETVTEQVKNAEDAALKANDAAKTATESAGMAETAAERAETAAANADTATTSAIEAAVAATGAAETAATATKEITGKAEGGGFTGTVKIGTVTTGAPGTEVKVENVGTDKDAVLDITIPQGSTGEIENIESATIEFAEAEERENIESGDTFGLIMGKLKKIISGLKAVAFSGEFSDLSDAPQAVNDLSSDSATDFLAAAQGKELDRKITELNGNMEVLEKRAYLKPSTGTAAYEGLGTTVSGVHLNTVTVPGLYFCAATDGRPVSSDGFMLVMSHTNGARGIQLYFPYTGGMYKRLKTSDAWGSWALVSNA